MKFLWDFGGGFGAITADVPPSDPPTGILYPSRIDQRTVLNSNGIQAGIVPPLTARTFPVKSLQWIYQSAGQIEELYGNDWAELTLLEDNPKLAFANQPQISPANVASLVEVTGSVVGGSVPIFVNIHFVARRRMVDLVVSQGQSVRLTQCTVQPDEVDVVQGGKTYEIGVDFTVTPDGTLKSINLPTGVALAVYYTEYYPAYSCSINQNDWSPDVMLDPASPYPDDATTFESLWIDGV